jgi:parallel beta-helix repeat protein
VPGTFWTDRESNRLYLDASDAGKPGIEVSEVDDWGMIAAADVTIEGIRITRYSNSADDYGVIDISATADNATLRNVEISDAAFQALTFNGKDADQIDGGMLESVTVGGANWMGVVAVYTDGVIIRDSLLTGLNRWDEFASSPQSGALKTSRTRRMKVIDSEISNNRGQGLWFDQSNYDIQVAGNVITENSANGVFFEISDKLLLINNYIRTNAGASGASVKLAGSSGLRLVNNTIVGGADVVGIYVDKRSFPGCSDPRNKLCAGSINSDRDIARHLPDTLDWMPRLDMMLNNVIAYPTAAGLCGERVNVCITDYNRVDRNTVATQPIDGILHPADPESGIPATVMNGNVYASEGGAIIGVPDPSNDATIGLSTLGAFSESMRKAKMSLEGLEADGLVGDAYVNGDGTPTEALSVLHERAPPVPVDTDINAYIVAGTRHFGVTYQ